MVTEHRKKQIKEVIDVVKHKPLFRRKDISKTSVSQDDWNTVIKNLMIKEKYIRRISQGMFQYVGTNPVFELRAEKAKRKSVIMKIPIKIKDKLPSQIIEEEYYDFGYTKILNKAKDLKKERQKQYGDGWTENKDYHSVALIGEKFRRLEKLIIDKQSDDYEKAEDTIIDLINWAAFLGANLDRRKNGTKD